MATRSPVVLGNVGLVQIIPVFLFTFAAGHMADRHDRRLIAVSTQIVVAVLGFALAAAGEHRGVTGHLLGALPQRQRARVSVAGQFGAAAPDGAAGRC